MTALMEFSPIFTVNTIVTVIIGILLFFYSLFRISRRYTYSTNQSLRPPPEAGGGLPLIGHLHLLGGNKEPTHVTLAHMANSYGPIFTLRLGLHKALVVSNWAIARECFTINDKIFASRPRLSAQKLLGYDSAMFGLSPYGPYWRQIRKIATSEILTNHRLEQLQHIRKSEVRSSIRELYDLCVKKSNDREDKVKVLVDMKKWFSDINLNTIFRIVLGNRFSISISTAIFNGVSNEKYRKALRDFFELSGKFVVSDCFPFLEWFDFGGYKKAMKKTAKELDEMVEKWLNEHRQRRRRSGEDHQLIDTDEHDLMDVMLSIVEDGQEFPGYDSDTVIKATCLALILGASDTTTITLTWALSLLLNNPETIKTAQLEIEEHVGKERQVEESDVKNLVYLQAIIKETLRLYPAGPLLIPRESTEDCTVAGYHIAAKTRLLVNLQKLQRDSVVWGDDATEFKPERFLTNQKEFEVRGQNYEFIPFGSGRRICPGITFALQIMHITLANLLHGFEIGLFPSGNKAVDMEESGGMTSGKRTPLEVFVAPRLPAHVYQ